MVFYIELFHINTLDIYDYFGNQKYLTVLQQNNKYTLAFTICLDLLIFVSSFSIIEKRHVFYNNFNIWKGYNLESRFVRFYRRAEKNREIHKEDLPYAAVGINKTILTEHLPEPPWVQALGEPKDVNYNARKYDFTFYKDYFKKLCEQKRSEFEKYQLNCTHPDELPGGRKTYGFKIKQIQPLRYHQGSVYAYFYLHMLDMSLSAGLINAFRRVLLEFIPAGRVTALRVDGMKHEFYSIVGVREEFFEISHNLRQIIFKNVPRYCSMDNAVYARFRIRGPMVVVAGHMQFFSHIIYTTVDDNIHCFTNDNQRYYNDNYFNSFRSYLNQSTVLDSNIASFMQNNYNRHINENENMYTLRLLKEESKMQNHVEIKEEEIKRIKIINPNQYICSVNAGHYLCLDVKIESINAYVMPESGKESLNRDIDINNFIHFCSSATPITNFSFQAERRAINREELTEVSTIELHTDGSITPRRALLYGCNVLLDCFYKLHFALHYNCMKGIDGTESVLHEDPELLADSSRYQGVPWNPWKSPDVRKKEKESFFGSRKFIVRQHKIDPDSEQAKEELKEEFYNKLKLENEINQRHATKGIIHEHFDSHEPLPYRNDEAYYNPPDWIPKKDVPAEYIGGVPLDAPCTPPLE